MASGPMSEEDLQDVKDNPANWLICPDGNFHKANPRPITCFCDDNGEIYQDSAFHDKGGNMLWRHIGTRPKTYVDVEVGQKFFDRLVRENKPR